MRSSEIESLSELERGKLKKAGYKCDYLKRSEIYNNRL